MIEAELDAGNRPLVDALYVTAALDKLRAKGKTPQDAVTELQNALRELHALQQKFVAQQAKQNLLDRLAQVETLEALQEAAAAVKKAQAEAGYELEKRELQAAVRERIDAFQLVERLTEEVEKEQLQVIEHERSRGAHESELTQLNDVWKEIQKRNARRKTAVQVATGVMITDEDDCNRVLDQQTQSIKEMRQKQKLLEDQRIDVSTQVKRTKRAIANMVKQNDMRSKDAEVKQREQDYMALQHMKKWYDHVRGIQESLSGLEIMKVADDYLEVRVLKSHLVRLFCDPETTRLQRVQFLASDVDAADLTDIAVRENDVRYMLCEYRERVREIMAL
ncbi:unnamed protein product [Hyaloperonospora brassicae]|uniref:Uncharacterized protein n=1 Tax=Hyaloperonospora brassicae TaxID=162125 RepID=A0AAV0TM33_HYABA|nr:unnamed protein product [Hyaloperonospora brassicae]